jgi:hypothetical protein
MSGSSKRLAGERSLGRLDQDQLALGGLATGQGTAPGHSGVQQAAQLDQA